MSSDTATPLAAAGPDLRALAEAHDAESRNTFLTFYADLTGNLDRHFFEKRGAVCRALLAAGSGASGGAGARAGAASAGARAAAGRDPELVENFDSGFGWAMKRLEQVKAKPGVVGAAVYASPAHGLFQVHELGLPVKDHLVVDSSPYIRPLARLAEEWESTALALIDQQNFKLFLLSLQGLKQVGSDSEHIMGRHKKGGCSQARFQRLRKGAIREFLMEAAADTARMVRDEGLEQVVVAGPGNAKQDFIEYLPAETRRKVIGVIDFHFKAPWAQLLDQTQEALEADERREETANVEALKGEVLTEGLAAYGLRQTRDAVLAGQAELLLVSQGLKAGGWKCEACQLFDTGGQGRCPSCKGPTTQVDFIEELAEQAHRTDAEVDFVADNEDLEALGGVAALLRYK